MKQIKTNSKQIKCLSLSKIKYIFYIFIILFTSYIYVLLCIIVCGSFAFIACVIMKEENWPMGMLNSGGI